MVEFIVLFCCVFMVVREAIAVMCAVVVELNESVEVDKVLILEVVPNVGRQRVSGQLKTVVA